MVMHSAYIVKKPVTPSQLRAAPLPRWYNSAIMLDKPGDRVCGRTPALDRVARSVVLALASLVALACAVERDATPDVAEVKSVFRHVDLGPSGRFELGESFDEHAHLAVEEKPGMYRLRDGFFSRAESIVVDTDKTGIVCRVHFKYGPASNYSRMLAGYRRSLGAPAQATESDAAWNDGRTEFRLVRASGMNHAARAEMRDLTHCP